MLRKWIILLLSIFIIIIIIVYHYADISSKTFLRTENKPHYEQGMTIIAFGDSLTEGLYNWPTSRKFHPYTKKLTKLYKEMYHNINVINAGKSGERTRTMRQRLSNILQENVWQNSLVLILAGTNDYIDMMKETKDIRVKSPYLQVETNKIFENIWDLHLLCHEFNISTGVISIPAVRLETFYEERGYSILRNVLNNKLKRYAEMDANKTIFVDLSSYLTLHNSTLLWDDGVHLTPYGYDNMAEVIHNCTKEFIKNLIKV